ncbi:MAG: signal peptidase II [Proteobacteria bacterium]|nr:signal peptidase II [Pseudomonadota bacterium]
MVKWLVLSVIILILDQVTKSYASSELILYQAVPVVPGFNLTLMHNTGAAFSILSQAGGWQRWFFIVLASIISLAIIIWMFGLPKDRRWLLTALAFVLGGALGNLWDRINLGYVVDFIEVYYREWYWPAFNVADSAITIGAIMLIIDAFLFSDAKIES